MTYTQLKAELDEVLIKLQDPSTDLDEAVKLHESGKKLLKKLEAYIDKAEVSIKAANKKDA